MHKEYKINELIKISEMFSLFSLFYEQDYVFSGEVHNFWECVIVLDGAICVSADERVCKLKKNEMIFHKPLELHKFYIDSPQGAELFIFSFSLTGSYASFFENKAFSLSPSQQKYVRELLSFLRSKSDNMHEYIAPFEESSTYSQMTVSYIYQLFLSLIEENPSTDISVSKEGNARIFSSAVNFMAKNVATSISVADVAKRYHVSETVIKQIFRKYAGMGVHQYFTRLKINTAIQMLEQNMTVASIAEKLGFSSQNYFSYAFKRETGYSPTEYRCQKRSLH